MMIRGETGTRDYPILARYCAIRHYPVRAGYYFKMWLGNLSRFCDSGLYTTYSETQIRNLWCTLSLCSHAQPTIIANLLLSAREGIPDG